jgi:hypothetical protein
MLGFKSMPRTFPPAIEMIHTTRKTTRFGQADYPVTARRPLLRGDVEHEHQQGKESGADHNQHANKAAPIAPRNQIERGGSYAPCRDGATQLAIAVVASSRANMLLSKVIKSLTVVCLRFGAGVDIK